MVIIEEIRTEKHLVTANIKVGARKHELVFRSHLEFSAHAADALLLLALPAAMRRGRPLIVDAPVSPQLLAQLPAIQEFYNTWKPNMKLVDVKAPPRELAVQTRQPSHIRNATTFTAGVDSFYSAIRMPGASLVYVHGFDIPLKNLDLRKKVTEKLAWAASELDRPLLQIETNLRSFSDRYLKWNLAYGGALAACALLLSRHIDDFGIPAGQSEKTFRPGGSHPILTSLFSTENLTIRTLDNDMERVDKVEAIAAHPVVQNALRVCWENPGNTYNCCVCEKCQRTMAALEIFGVLSDYPVFALPLDYGRLSRAVARTPALERFIRENLQKAQEKHASPGLIKSLEKSLDPRRAWLFRALHYRIPRSFYHAFYRLFRQNSR